MIKVVTLILGPILCGVVLFLIEAPAQTPGAYLEITEFVYSPLSACRSETVPAKEVWANAPVVPQVRSFFLVLADRSSAPVSAQSARLYLRVVNHAEPGADYGREPIATTVHRMNAHVYRITSDPMPRWDAKGLTGSIYRQALSRHPGNRATTELQAELETRSPSGGFCRYAVTLGPPPSLPDLDVKWYVRPPERRQ
jgi:hypothetical protein